jgi:hypothetical protein
MKGAYIILIFLLAFCFSSCEKVIDINLRESEPLLVIEGNINNQGPFSEVLISETFPFSSLEERVPVSGAIVIIQEDNNSPMLLLEEGSGRYILNNFKGKPGSTYNLKVSVNGKDYESISTMPQPVELDSVGTISTDVFSETIKSTAVIYNDPVDIKNYYRFKVKINEVENNTYWVFNDRFTNGKVVTQTLNDLSNKLQIGNLVTVEMQCIDSAVYDFWNSLGNQNLGAAVPSNPISNISNGSLGYFSAHTISYTNFEVK